MLYDIYGPFEFLAYRFALLLHYEERSGNILSVFCYLWAIQRSVFLGGKSKMIFASAIVICIIPDMEVLCTAYC